MSDKTTTHTGTAPALPATPSDPDYHRFERLVAGRVAAVTTPLFTTDAAGLWESYLAGISEAERRHYDCHACKRFIERYGGLVVMTEDGTTMSPLWAIGVPSFFADSTSKMRNVVCAARVTGVYLDGAAVWGEPISQPKGWTHLAGTPPAAAVFRSSDHGGKTAGQVMAEKREDYGMLCRGLAEFPMEAVVQAVRVLESNEVDRGEKTLGAARWLLDLHRRTAGIKGPRRGNLIWLAVATAPPGWCHVRSGMIGTLLVDIVSGLRFDEIRARWNEKMHPLQYQRPTAPIREGQVRAANAVVERLGSAGALRRRFARLSDVLAFVWQPRAMQDESVKAVKPAGGGAFDHLLLGKNAVKPVELPARRITWERFAADVLPTACRLECQIPSGRAGFYGLVTAADPAAPPILQWDGLEGLPRNPVSWFFYHGGSPASQWGLTPGAWVPVNGVFLKPCYWQRPDQFTHQGPGVFFALQGCRDTAYKAGGGFFPESLRSEYHAVRPAMEAHAGQAVIAGLEEGDANGIALTGTGSGAGSLVLRVVDENRRMQEYIVAME